MDNHESPWIIMVHHGESAGRKKKMYVGKLGGHERVTNPSKSNNIGTNRILMIKSIDLSCQNKVLTYPGVRISRKY